VRGGGRRETNEEDMHWIRYGDIREKKDSETKGGSEAWSVRNRYMEISGNKSFGD
jgi:hypothetical protein